MSKFIKIPIPKQLFQQNNFSELTSNLSSLEEIANIETSAETSTVTFEIESTDVYKPIADEFSKLGYEIPTNTVKLGITGMTCASCVMHIENSISNLNGVIKSNVNLATNQATITVINGTVSDSEISNSVSDIGYGTFDISESAKNVNSSDSKSILSKASFAIVSAVIINLFNYSSVESFFNLPITYLFLIIATPVQLWAGRYFYVRAWIAL